MALSSISTACGHAAAAPTICLAPTEAQTDAAQPATAPPPPRRHPMRDALMAGFEALGVVEPGTTTEGSAAGTAGASDATQRKTVTDAVLDFMHTLGDALRHRSGDASGDGAGSERGVDRAERLERRELRYERRVERREERRAERREDAASGYGDIADRLEALATAIRAHAQTSDPAPTTPALASDAPTIAASASAATAEPSAKAEANPLVAAFGKVLAALKQPDANGAAAAQGASARLADFLHQLAQRLAPAGDAAGSLRAGLLVDVSA